MKARYPVLVTLLLLSLLLTVYAAWTPIENFDGYTPGTSMEGLSGGSGWTTNWDNSPNTGFTVETAPAGGQGGIAAKKTGTSSLTTSRRLAGITVGSVHFEARISATPSSDQFVGITLHDAGGPGDLMLIKFSNGGQIQIYDNAAGYQNIQAFSTNTWYDIDIDFDDTGQPNLYRARIDGGSWTAYKTVVGGNLTEIDFFFIKDTHTADHDFWVDDIRETSTQSVVPVLKRYYDLLRSSLENLKRDDAETFLAFATAS